MIKGSKHRPEIIEKIRQSCIGVTRVHDSHVEINRKLACENCGLDFFYSKYEKGRKFCTIVCSAEKQWKQYKKNEQRKEVRLIGDDWIDYHKLPTKAQEYMLEDFKEYMCEKIYNNKAK